jgi:hypothetical protein
MPPTYSNICEQGLSLPRMEQHVFMQYKKGLKSQKEQVFQIKDVGIIKILFNCFIHFSVH